MQQKITPFLWFENNAEEAAKFYVELFLFRDNNSKILTTTHYDEAGAKASGMPKGSIMTVEFELDGQKFIAINGGPSPEDAEFKFTPAISFVINCQTQDEIDYFWEKLSSNGGETWPCGWIKHDKFGITWQIVPEVLDKLLADPDKEKSKRVMEAMLKMEKLEIEPLLKAYEG